MLYVVDTVGFPYSLFCLRDSEATKWQCAQGQEISHDCFSGIMAISLSIAMTSLEAWNPGLANEIKGKDFLSFQETDNSERGRSLWC